MGRSSLPVLQSLLCGSYADYETFTISVRADTALRIERSRTFWYNGSLRRLAGVHGRGAGALFGRAVRGGRGGERRLADEGVVVILRDRASAAGIAPFTPRDMRRTTFPSYLTPAPT